MELDRQCDEEGGQEMMYYEVFIAQKIGLNASSCLLPWKAGDTPEGWRSQPFAIGTDAGVALGDVVTPGSSSGGKEGPFQPGFKCVRIKKTLLEEEQVASLCRWKNSVVVLSKSGRIHLITDELTSPLGSIEEETGYLACYDSGESLVAFGAQGSCKVWRVGEEPSPLHDLKLPRPARDVSSVACSPNTFAVLAASAELLFFDDRDMRNPASAVESVGQSTHLRCSPTLPHICLTAGTDPLIALWDIRSPNESLHEFAFEEAAHVSAVEWAPHREGVFACMGGSEGVVGVWDCNHIGEESEEGYDNRSELVFQHIEHRGEQGRALAWGLETPDVLLTLDSVGDAHYWKLTDEMWGL